MKIDKIKNYNQVILAIAGTIGVILLAFAALIMLEELSRSFFRDRDGYNNSGVLAMESVNELQKDSLRQQIISFNKIEMIDSVSQTYIIPVTQANLAAAEEASEILGLVNTRSGSRSYRGGYDANIYNNLVLYKQLEKESEIVFKERISIGDFLIHDQAEDKYIVIPACDIDSNKDGYLNEGDLQELFIYDLQKEQLNKIEAKENYTTLRVYQPEMSDDLIVHFGIDRNRDGSFDRWVEPMVFYQINLDQMKIQEFVSKEQLTKLQSLLEGR